MPKFSQAQLFIAGIILVSGLILVGSFLLSGKKLPFFAKLIPPPSPSPIPRIPNVYYPLVPDPSGRNIYYITSDGNQGSIPFSGAGVLLSDANTRLIDEKGNTVAMVASPSAMTKYIVATFKSWKEIPGSKDRYLVLENPAGIRTPTGELIPIPKIRIGFSIKNLDNKTTFDTAVGAEDLDSVIPKVADKTQGLKTYKLGLIGDLEPTDLATLIKPGDTVAITIKIDLAKKRDLTDKDQVKVASWLFIRRFNPQVELNKELNKVLKME
ncbi:hypothetical protein M1437_04560 [Patescibacteria group bacterium]|nr:hypothetical protein [Patescibacteria group bacterium]